MKREFNLTGPRFIAIWSRQTKRAANKKDIWLKFEQRVCATFRSYQSQINSEDEYKEIKFLLRFALGQNSR